MGAVDFVAEQPSAAPGALPVAGLPAGRAGSTRGDTRHENSIPDPHCAYRVADGGDGSDGLVAEDPSALDLGHIFGHREKNDHIAFVDPGHAGQFDQFTRLRHATHQHTKTRTQTHRLERRAQVGRTITGVSARIRRVVSDCHDSGGADNRVDRQVGTHGEHARLDQQRLS